MWVPPSVFMSCFTICLPILWNPIWYPHVLLTFLAMYMCKDTFSEIKKSPMHVWRHLFRQQSRLWFSWPFPIYMSPTPVLLLALLQQDDTHCGWSVSALASLEQDMHDVSEIECHARGFWMERGMKRGAMTDEARSTKRERNTKVGWRETGGLKVLGRKRDKDGKEGSSDGRGWGVGDKHMETDRKRLFFECQCCTLLAQA